MALDPKIASFLDLGYFMDYKPRTIRFPENIQPVDQSDVSREELFITVRKMLLKAFDDGFSPGQVCVVPLSGGCDSRAVLGGLLQFTEASNIITYTFGNPGSYDFEIAGRVAREVGVSNVRIPLDQYQYSLEELIETSERMDSQALMFFHAPLKVIKREFPGGVHWSGFLGDVIAGSHIRKEPLSSWAQAEQYFLERNRFVKGPDEVLLEGADHYTLSHLCRPEPGQGFQTYEEPLDMLNRQNKFIAPHVMMKGFEHRAPFNDTALIEFFLGLTHEQKLNQAFFYEFLQWWKPWLFDLPVKSMMGLGLGAAPWRPTFRKKWLGLKKRLGFKNDPNVNYFDLSRRLIDDAQFKSLVWSQLSELKERHIVDELDIRNLWREHQMRRADHTNLIQGLFSLEVHLKAGKEL
ncbi:MAG: asparagine synthase-related protein [Marinilabiliaceae bacterium]